MTLHNFFNGWARCLLLAEVEVLKVSPTTVERDWTMAKAWLRKTVMSDE